MTERLHYGCWSKDKEGLPYFDGTFHGPVAVERPFSHGFSSGRLNVLVNRWGLVHLFTTEGGYTDLSANAGWVRSGLYLELVVDGVSHPLVHGDLPEKEEVRYGIGYACFAGSWRSDRGQRLTIGQEFYTPPDRTSHLGGAFEVKNTGNVPVTGLLRVRADVRPAMDRPTPRLLNIGDGFCCWPDFSSALGDYQLRGPDDWKGVNCSMVALALQKEISLAPGDTLSGLFSVGYGESLAECLGPDASRHAWAQQFRSVRFDGVPEWMNEEALWCMGQLYSFLAYDSSVGEHYLNLGGYGWPSFGVREVPETALTVAAWDRELAFSCLRWTAKVQYSDGNIPHLHTFRRPRSGESLDTGHFESDNEIWFVLACAEVIQQTGATYLLDEPVPFWQGEIASMWEHLRRAVAWIRDGIGLGSHGLIRIAEGDWNDYLSYVGTQGRGESMMNTGMACCALSRLLPLARERDLEFADECERLLSRLRQAAEKGFDQGWFVRGYTDEGKPFGTFAEDRVFINAQSWCVLGGCGTRAMQELAMRAVLEKCHTSLGLTLMSRSFSCPPPPEVSSCPIPPGDGENAGIWPQTVHWVVWALAELGWKTEALAVWERMSLRNHARLYPEVPFGIFNGPDCYSSHHAGDRTGWTQVELLARSKFPPMNPIVAWQAFGLQHILQAPE